jgi:hypothetical protein
MRGWFAAAELVGLPGLPGTIRSINRLATVKDWTSRRRADRGGGNEYHVESLPEHARVHLAARLLRESDAPASRDGQVDAQRLQLVEATQRGLAQRAADESLRDAHGLTPSEQRRLAARLEIYRQWIDFYRLSGLTKVDSQYRYAEQYNASVVPMDDEYRTLYPTISRGTLARWESDLRRHGVTRLAGNYGNRKGQSKIHRQPEIIEYLQAVLVTYPHITARTMHEGLCARFSAADHIDLPSVRTVRRWLNQWKAEHAEVFTAIANPDKWKSRYMVAHGSLSESITRLNQRWEFDATPADVLLIDGRHVLIGVVDVYSRRLKLLVSRTSKAVAVAAVMRRAMLDWGVPEVAVIDNGKEFVGHHITRVCTSLEIRQDLCPPFQPWLKPHIERAFRTFAHDLVELMPGYCGHNIAERRELEARKSFADRMMTKGGAVEIRLTAAELQRFADRWCDSIYEHRPHEGLGGRTPFQLVADWRGDVRRIQNERALDILLADAPDNHGWRTVAKKGIRIKWPQQPTHHWYIAPELGVWVNQKVFVAYDPAGDMGRIYVFGGEGFLCIAECPELTGVNRQEYAAIAKARQREAVQTARRALKQAARGQGVEDLADEILAFHEQRVAAVTLFPRPGTPHESAGLSQATDAAAAAAAKDAPREITPVSDDAMQRITALMAQDERPAEAMETPEGRFAFALSLLDHQDTAADPDLEWLRSYQQTSEFRGRYLAWRELGAGRDREDLADDPWLTPVRLQAG